MLALAGASAGHRASGSSTRPRSRRPRRSARADRRRLRRPERARRASRDGSTSSPSSSRTSPSTPPAARRRACRCFLRRSARSRSRRTGSPRSSCSHELGIAAPPFAAVDPRGASPSAASRTIGLPAVLKTRRLGYDGKGQAGHARRPAWPSRVARSSAACRSSSKRFVAVRPRAVDPGRARARRRDRLLPARREPAPRAASCGASAGARARRHDGARRAGPSAHARARPGDARLRRRARDRAVPGRRRGCSPTRWRRACTTRGHWTIEGAETSQFENHLRAVAGPAARHDGAASA